ncbi:hypothetical protein GCM10010994_28100 [Chelatococcus reniformis]|uniref:Uncharacterized protein n=1 Tax=Chelatococcus reniformis TaxID=1494448 RepID=A0A916XG20_9HYPH|nr:hypothetical protein GCM10010994_28100 [Chelatococcus reniformis]
MHLIPADGFDAGREFLGPKARPLLADTARFPTVTQIVSCLRSPKRAPFFNAEAGVSASTQAGRYSGYGPA